MNKANLFVPSMSVDGGEEKKKFTFFQPVVPGRAPRQSNRLSTFLRLDWLPPILRTLRTCGTVGNPRPVLF